MADIEGAITLDVAFSILGRRQSGPGALLLSREASLALTSVTMTCLNIPNAD